jgi:signal transduction histidine kinase
MNRRTFRYLSACFFFSLLGFLGNWFNFELFFNVDFLMGPFFVMLAILLLGEPFGVITGFITATSTFFLWNHPWAIIIMTGEAFFVTFRVRRHQADPIISDMLYWALIGMPLVYVFYHQVMAIQPQITLLIMLKQAMNGIFNTLMATIVFLLLNQARYAHTNPVPYSRAIFVTMVALVLIPAMLVLVIGMRRYVAHEKASLDEKLSYVSAIAQKSLSNWIGANHLAIQTLSALAGNPDVTPVATLQHYIETFKAATPAFFRMGVINDRSITIAYAPLTIDGKSTLGVDFSDRPYIALMREKKQPFIPDVVMGKLGTPIPIALLLAPIVVDNRYKGYASGVIDTSGLSDVISRLSGQNDIYLTLVDGTSHVIASSHLHQQIMDIFLPPYSLSHQKKNSETVHWIPDPQPGTSIMQRWRASLLIKTSPLSPDCNWQLIAEAPLLPVVDQVCLFSIKGLALLALVAVFTVVLSHLFSKGVVSTVIQLQEVTKSMPERLASEAGIAWPESRILELEALCQNFREMARALIVSFRRQKQLNETLEERVIERTEALRESEERLRFALDSAQMGTFDYRPATGEVFWDENNIRKWGLTPHAQLTYADVIAMIHEQDRQRVEQAIRHALDSSAGGFFESECRMDRKDGAAPSWIVVKGRVCFEGMGAGRHAVRMSGTYQDATERKRIEVELDQYRQLLEKLVSDRTRELEKKNELLELEISERNQVENKLRISRSQLRALASRLQAAREEERIHIAREIHDVLAQELTRLKFDLVWLQRRLARSGSSAEVESLLGRISEMEQTADTAICSVQKIATELRPAVLDSLGLCAAVEWQARDFQTRSGISCRARVLEVEPRISRDAATAVFRILQESLTNVLRHADATRVDISLQQADNQFMVTIQDNGCGIAPETVVNPLSIGLTGMRERTLLLGGQFTVHGRPGSGTLVEVRLPLSPAADSFEDSS